MTHPIRAPELSELRTLMVAVDEGSLNRAARRLRLSLPAVRKRIANLEALAGAPLLERSPLGVVPTPRGRDVLERAGRILAEADDLVAFLGLPLDEEVPATPAAALAHLERFVGRWLHTSREPLALVDRLSGVVVEANDAFCELVGRPAAELVGRVFTDVAPAARLDAAELFLDGRRTTLVRAEQG